METEDPIRRFIQGGEQISVTTRFIDGDYTLVQWERPLPLGFVLVNHKRVVEEVVFPDRVRFVDAQTVVIESENGSIRVER